MERSMKKLKNWLRKWLPRLKFNFFLQKCLQILTSVRLPPSRKFRKSLHGNLRQRYFRCKTIFSKVFKLISISTTSGPLVKVSRTGFHWPGIIGRNGRIMIMKPIKADNLIENLVLSHMRIILVWTRLWTISFDFNFISSNQMFDQLFDPPPMQWPNQCWISEKQIFETTLTILLHCYKYRIGF